MDGVGADSDNAIDAPLEPDLRPRVQRRRPGRRLRRHVVTLLLLVLHKIILHVALVGILIIFNFDRDASRYISIPREEAVVVDRLDAALAVT